MEAKLTPSRSLFNKEVVSSDESSESSSDGDTQIRLGKTDWGAQDTVILPGPTTQSNRSSGRGSLPGAGGRAAGGRLREGVDH